MTRRGLGPAHRGYLYQDIASAYALAKGLLRPFHQALIDQKLFAGDIFDDLSLTSASGGFRAQFKSGHSQPLEEHDLAGTGLDARIDRLVSSAIQSPAAYSDLRLCVSRSAPAAAWKAVLRSSSRAQLFEDSRSEVFELDAGSIWPADAKALWHALEGVSRDDFLAFAARFTLETSCPPASLDLGAPGELETLLLKALEEDVGVGAYPNDSLNLADTAARLILLVQHGRAQAAALDPARLIRELRLKTDFGRIAQSFPVVPSQRVQTASLQDELRAAAGGGGNATLVGPPGSGKSWSLTRLAEDLAAEGAVVARHYCYLEPGDANVQLRITTRRALSNLLAEIIDQRPALAETNRPFYAAGALQLERVLETLARQEDRVVLIVDGLDHIARVLAEARDLAPGDTDIIEELASLRLPASVSLIIGSQPGPHLDGLPAGIRKVEVPAWDESQTAELAKRNGLVDALARRPTFDQPALLRKLHHTADGNPLYATFLCRELIQRLEFDQALAQDDLFADLPHGNLTAYYAFLLKSLPQGALAVAELLGLVDFGVTTDELCEIFPVISGLIRTTIRTLAPVLKNVASQGGVRIYHESFRRYIVEEMQRRGDPIAEKLTPIIEWLKRRQFFEDSKAFRFLLPCLRRANRLDELLDLVGADFISRGVASGQPQLAIWSNLQLAISVAVELKRWAHLARLTELHRTLHTCFEEKLLDVDLYGRTFATLFGAKALVERLLFDGRPTLSSSAGILMCSVADDLGEIPPWESYLDLPDDSGEDRDASKGLSRTHGITRTLSADELLERVKVWLADSNPDPDERYFRGVVSRLGKQFGSRFLAALLRTKAGSNRARLRLRIEMAEALKAEGRGLRAARLATAILKRATDPGDALACLLLGADRDAASAVDLSAANTDVLAPMVEHDGSKVRKWRHALGVLAFVRPGDLDAVAKRIEAESWYRYWLLFAIEIARVEAEVRDSAEQAEARAVRAIGLLVKEVHPFAGDPRACDLYRLHGEIYDSISTALTALRSRENWAAALRNLETVTLETTTFLQNSPNGPLTREAFSRLLLSHMGAGAPSDLLCDAIARIVLPAHESGYYFESLAEHEMYFAQALVKAGRREEALQAWQRAAVFLTGYGFRKDSTVFELIDCLPSLHKVDPRWTMDAFWRVQRLIRAVIAHTDGKTTRHAPGHWFDALIQCEPVKAIDLLAESLSSDGGLISGRLETALGDVIDRWRTTSDPLLIYFLESTNPPPSGASRISGLGRLKAEYPDAFRTLLPVALAEAQGDPHKFAAEEFEGVAGFCRSEGLAVAEQPYPLEVDGARSQSSSSLSAGPRNPFAVRTAIFSRDARPSELMASFRKMRRLDEEADYEDRLANGVGYRIVEMLQTGREKEALRVLHSFATEYYTFSEKASALAAVASGLERHGYKNMASIAYALAYARSRGGGGWLSLGGAEQQPWLAKAAELSSTTAQETIAREIARLLETPGYIIGITRHLAELSSPWLTGAERIAIWEAAYDVINRRLPTSQDDPDSFAPVRESLASGMNADEALGYLLISRLCHPELERKKAAVAGISFLLKSRANLLVKGIRKALTQNTSESVLSLLLSALWQWESAPFDVTKSVLEPLGMLCASANLTHGQFATRLLSRAGCAAARGYAPIVLKGAKPLSSHQIKLALSVDVADRVERVASVWPDLPAEVAGRFEEFWEQSTVNKPRSRGRHEASRSNAQREIPPTYMYWWESELFDIAFDDALSQLESLAWSEGEWAQNRMDSLLSMANPDLRMRRAVWLARRIRPPMPLPTALQDGQSALQPLSGAGRFDGWYRWAAHERQAILDRPSYPTFKGWRDVYAGALVGGLKGHSPKTLPFGSGGPTLWEPEARPPGVFKAGVGRALVSLFVLRDRLGLDHIFGLDRQLKGVLGLQPAPDALSLVDGAGREKAVFRRWRVRPLGEDIDEEQPVLSGCELLVHPDVHSVLMRLCGNDISMVTSVADHGR